MFMIDILRLDGVEAAREKLLDEGALNAMGVPSEHAYVDDSKVDDLIRIVAEAVEAETHRKRQRERNTRASGGG